MIPLEKQVCSLELARKLKALGVKQESLFWWYRYYQETDAEPIEGVGIEYQGEDGRGGEMICSAFTVAELGEMLPIHHNYGVPQSGKCNKGDEYVAGYIHWGNLWHDRAEFNRYRLKESFVADTEADARALCLI
jgi:hypothetical protein